MEQQIIITNPIPITKKFLVITKTYLPLTYPKGIHSSRLYILGD